MSERTCEHWEMAFCVVNRTVFVKCMNCKGQGTLPLDGADTFTTSWAKMAINGKGQMLKDAINLPLQGEGD